MTDPNKQKADAKVIHDATQRAVERGEDIRNEVQKITVKALTEGQLEPKRVKHVIEAVLEGARSGAVSHAQHLTETLKQTVTGLDEALVKAAEATKLAIEEAAGRAGDFSEREMKHSLNDLETLEKMFLDTVNDMVVSSKDQTGEILNDLLEHAQHSGTAVGRYAIESLSDLQHQTQKIGKEAFQASSDAALETSNRIIQIASGFLAGIADSLHTQATLKTKNQSDDRPD